MSKGTRAKYVVGNWKMNQTLDQVNSFFCDLYDLKADCHIWIAPQSVHIAPSIKATENSAFKIGGQNCCEHNNGAFTGEVSPHALKDLGAEFVIIGHSERREIYGESHALLNAKVRKALDNNLTVIFCIGETLEQRESDSTNTVLANQLSQGLKGLGQLSPKQIVIAYEPVWAIGTGKTATPQMAEDAHKFVRSQLSELGLAKDEISILYGGSVKPSNAKELFAQPNIDGGLVGGASLNPNDFKALTELFT